MHLNTGNTILKAAIIFARLKLAEFDSGHDWYHTERVLKMARHIYEEEKSGDLLVIELAAVLHDIADTKFHEGSEEEGGNMAYDFLLENGLETKRAEHVRSIINSVSFKKHRSKGEINSIEFKIVQDADRLDALGAIGIARAFNYGGYRNRPIYDPLIPPEEFSTLEAYKKSASPTINHFHEKLFLLKGLMNTETGKQLASLRHDYMVGFVVRFLEEWEGKL